MQSNIKYANTLIIALAIAYFIIGGINLLGVIDGKVIFLCSIVSCVVAIIQILDTIISGLRTYEVNVLKISVGFLKAWGIENSNQTIEQKNKKIDEFKKDQKDIHNKYCVIIKRLSLATNVLLTATLIFFIFGLSTDFIEGNSKIADTLSLFSFALIFVSLTVQTYLEKCINSIETELKCVLETDEEMI